MLLLVDIWVFPVFTIMNSVTSNTVPVARCMLAKFLRGTYLSSYSLIHIYFWFISIKSLRVGTEISL